MKYRILEIKEGVFVPQEKHLLFWLDVHNIPDTMPANLTMNSCEYDDGTLEFFSFGDCKAYIENRARKLRELSENNFPEVAAEYNSESHLWDFKH